MNEISAGVPRGTFAAGSGVTRKAVSVARPPMLDRILPVNLGSELG